MNKTKSFKSKAFISKVSNINNSKVTNSKQVNEDDCDDETLIKHSSLPYFKKTQAFSVIEINIDQDVSAPSYYRVITQAIRDTDEHDLIRFYINSNGGRLDGLMSILSSMWKTEATTEAHIDGFCDSAASMLALHCDNVYVSPLSSMLVHNAAYGIGGKSADIKAHVDHFTGFFDSFFKETYKGFLTDDEVEKCLNGYQLYLDAENIMQRLKVKYELMQAEQQATEELQQEEKPEVTSSKKKTRTKQSND